MPYKRLADKPEKIRTHIVDVKMGDESLLTGNQVFAATIFLNDSHWYESCQTAESYFYK